MSHIYFNTHTYTYSIRNRVDGKYKVTNHSDIVAVYKPSSNVQQGGRKRVIATKTKNVHAFIIGQVGSLPETPTAKIADIYYNPFKVDEFKAIMLGNNDICSLNELVERKGDSISEFVIIGRVVDKKPRMELHALNVNNAPMLTRKYFKYVAEAYDYSIELHRQGKIVTKNFEQDYSRSIDCAWYVEYYA